jgi:hypothetical protein
VELDARGRSLRTALAAVLVADKTGPPRTSLSRRPTTRRSLLVPLHDLVQLAARARDGQLRYP